MQPMTDSTRARAACAMAAAGAIAVAALGLAGCGSDAASSTATATRQAAGTPDADGACPERTGSLTQPIRIVNTLPARVTFRVPRDQVDCYDWSGVSTPYTAFNGQALALGQELSRQLELKTGRGRASSLWTMGIRAVGREGTAVGTRRMFIAPAGIGAEGATPVPNREHKSGATCWFSPTANAPANWGDTPDDAREFRGYVTIAVGVRNKEVGYFFCLPPGRRPDNVV